MTATAQLAAGAVRRSPPALLALPAAAAALGGSAIGLQYLGVGQRPVPSLLILLTGLGAALVPLRIGLPVAVVLACFQTTIGDFFGPPGRYWKELFVAVFVLRALRRRPLGRGELAAVVGIVCVYVAYLATGTPLLAVGWAAKILFIAALAGWAVYRLGASRAEWTAVYYGLAVAAGANVVLGIWQRAEGWAGLTALGLPYGTRVRQAPTGALRSFGGFTTAAPFAYTLALVVLAWIAFLVAGSDQRRIAAKTAWVPVAALAGIALSLDRIALVGLTAAVLLGALRHFRNRAALALLTLTPVAVGLVLVLAGPSARSFLLQGFTFGSKSADTRRLLWREYGRELDVFGHGPGSAGAAYGRAVHREAPVVRNARGWYALERDASGHRFQWMATRAGLLVGESAHDRRRVRLDLYVSSFAVGRTLTVSYGRAILAAARVPPVGSATVRVLVPAGRGQVLVRLAVRPPGQIPGRASPRDRRRLSIRLDGLSALDAGPPRDETAAIYARVRKRAGAGELRGTAPGVVDNLYLAWLFQYGLVLGFVLCAAWAFLPVRPTILAREDDDALVVAMRLWGLFLVVAALVVNIWEEFPVDFLVAVGFALLYGSGRRARSPAAR